MPTVIFKFLHSYSGSELQKSYTFQMHEFSQAEWDHQLERNARVVQRAAVTGNGTLWKTGVFEKIAVDCTSRAMVVALKHKETGEVFSIANVHLEGHPDATDMRQRQLATAIKKGRKRTSHLVVAGDFNQEDPLTSMTKLHRVPTGPSWSNGAGSLCIDHITVDSISLRVESVRGDIYNGNSPIPNAEIPSDHSPIMCLLCVCGAPQGGVAAPKTPGEGLSDEVRASIRSQHDALLLTAPAPVRGKPNPEQLEVLQQYAMRKKVFLAQYADDEDEHSFAKALLDKKMK